MTSITKTPDLFIKEMVDLKAKIEERSISVQEADNKINAISKSFYHFISYLHSDKIPAFQEAAKATTAALNITPKLTPLTKDRTSHHLKADSPQPQPIKTKSYAEFYIDKMEGFLRDLADESGAALSEILQEFDKLNYRYHETLGGAPPDPRIVELRKQTNRFRS